MSKAKAQTAVVAEVVGASRGFTASRSSGFSFYANGTLDYTGPLNELRPIDLTGSTILYFGDRAVEVRADDALIQSRMPTPQGHGNTLSAELADSQVPGSEEPRQVEIGYNLILPGITGVSASNTVTKYEQVDGQSFSIFTSFSPSVFP